MGAPRPGDIPPPHPSRVRARAQRAFAALGLPADGFAQAFGRFFAAQHAAALAKLRKAKPKLSPLSVRFGAPKNSKKKPPS